jgi:hypothetical protein
MHHMRLTPKLFTLEQRWPTRGTRATIGTPS